MRQDTVSMRAPYEACTSCRYNETLVALYGASANTAIYYTATFNAAAQGHPPPYLLSMQTVIAGSSLPDFP